MSKRKEVKAGKRERIRKLLNNIRAKQDRFDDNHTLAETMDRLGSDRRSTGTL